MARPIKTGLDYFPKDTGSFSDRKIRRLLSEFGAKGYMIFDYLLCVIYSDNGYYVLLDDHFMFDVADALQCGIKEDLVQEVINGCVRVGLFDKDRFENAHILTSPGIQNRYLSAKRGGVISDEINVLTSKTRVIDAITQINDAESTQSKVKQSKVKQSKAEGVGYEKKIDQLHTSLCEWFGFTEQSHFKNFSESRYFLKILENQNQIEGFELQFSAYKQLKNESQEKKHRFDTFIGTAHEKHQDGAWCKENWVKIYDEFKQRAETTRQSNNGIHGATGPGNNHRARPGDRGDKKW